MEEIIYIKLKRKLTDFALFGAGAYQYRFLKGKLSEEGKDENKTGIGYLFLRVEPRTIHRLDNADHCYMGMRTQHLPVSL